MEPAFLHQLRGRSALIRERWEALLRVEPVSGPLANPDTLVHLIPQTLEQILAQFAVQKSARVLRTPTRAESMPPCECGNNPYHAYFIAGEQAMVEAVVLLQAELPPRQRVKSDVVECISVVRRLAHAEIEAFCGICVHRGAASKCRHLPPSRSREPVVSGID